MFKKLLTILLLLLGSICMAQKSFLSGSAKNYANHILRVYAYSDYLTLSKIEIGKTKIDSIGNFGLFILIDHTQFIFVETETSRSSFYAEPGKNYSLEIPKLGLQETPTISIHGYAPVKIKSADSLELNNLISKFENYLDGFYQTNLYLIARKAVKKEAQKFRLHMQNRFSYSNNTYFKNYLKYKLATLDAASGFSKTYLFKNYFKSKIEYKSLEYMQFFNQTFTKHLEQLASTSKGVSIESSISLKRNYASTMSAILKADTLFRNDTLRELLLLKGLNEFYYLQKINKRNVLSLITHVEQKGLGSGNKKIAHNLLLLLTKMQEGTPAPAFELVDQNKKKVKLENFKGKYVYLDFWATWCLPCLQELKLKQSLKEKYGNEIQFISISLDKKFASMYSYLNNNKNLNSLFLYAGMDQDLLERYNVKAIPCYYIIDPQGLLYSSPAKKPSENIQLLFQTILKNQR